MQIWPPKKVFAWFWINLENWFFENKANLAHRPAAKRQVKSYMSPSSVLTLLLEAGFTFPLRSAPFAFFLVPFLPLLLFGLLFWYGYLYFTQNKIQLTKAPRFPWFAIRTFYKMGIFRMTDEEDAAMDRIEREYRQIRLLHKLTLFFMFLNPLVEHLCRIFIRRHCRGHGVVEEARVCSFQGVPWARTFLIFL